MKIICNEFGDINLSVTSIQIIKLKISNITEKIYTKNNTFIKEICFHTFQFCIFWGVASRRGGKSLKYTQVYRFQKLIGCSQCKYCLQQFLSLADLYPNLITQMFPFRWRVRRISRLLYVEVYGPRVCLVTTLGILYHVDAVEQPRNITSPGRGRDRIGSSIFSVLCATTACNEWILIGCEREFRYCRQMKSVNSKIPSRGMIYDRNFDDRSVTYS